MREVIKTGISGLDDLLKGGIPKQNQVFIVGAPGTGKTLLSLEFLYHGAENEEKGIFFALEEPSNAIIKNFGSTFTKFDLMSAMAGNKIKFVDVDLQKEEFGLAKFSNMLQDEIKKFGASRVVIDSATIAKYLTEDEFTFRKSFSSIINLLRNKGVTSFLTGEVRNLSREITFEPEHYISDGIIALYNMLEGQQRYFALEILKMRGSNHSKMMVPYLITNEGIKLKSSFYSPER